MQQCEVFSCPEVSSVLPWVTGDLKSLPKRHVQYGPIVLTEQSSQSMERFAAVPAARLAAKWLAAYMIEQLHKRP